MQKIAIFASGSGSNAEQIATYFANSTTVEIALILSNNPQAGVIARARQLQIPVVLFDKKTFYNTSKITQILQNEQINLVVLAGFMMLIPEALVRAFPNK
ncbi:MAG: phosphoribosylglycinamide formyltransferase, partial [Runella slithyformis]